ARCTAWSRCCPRKNTTFHRSSADRIVLTTVSSSGPDRSTPVISAPMWPAIGRTSIPGTVASVIVPHSPPLGRFLIKAASGGSRQPPRGLWNPASGSDNIRECQTCRDLVLISVRGPLGAPSRGGFVHAPAWRIALELWPPWIRPHPAGAQSQKQSGSHRRCPTARRTLRPPSCRHLSKLSDSPARR